MWEYISKIFYVVGEAVTLLMAMLFFALVVWGGKISININGLGEIFKRWG